MTSQGTLSVVLGDYPHTAPLKSGAIPIEGVACSFPQVTPLPGAFARMVRELEFDLCEMALTTYIQAREAGVPVTLLPAVMVGGTHHRSLIGWPGGSLIGPRELIGQAVGVRAYGQTTGMWVRGILREEHQVQAGDITWLTTEDCHVAQYTEPDNVERGSGSIGEWLRAGTVSAAILSPREVTDQGVELVPVIPDAADAAAAWIERHQTVPVNHMVVVRSDLIESDPDAVRAVYAALARAIDATAGERGEGPAERVIASGWTDALRRCVEVATRYCLEQQLLRAPLDWDQTEREVRILDA
jgi:4,5-dihydroxyphthalate decarboxylase